MRFTTANIRALPPMTRAAVRGDMSEVAATSDVIGFQEIRLPMYVDQLRELNGFDKSFNGIVSTPFAWRSNLCNRGRVASETLHQPVTGITREKHVTAQHLFRLTKPQKRFVATNRHYVSEIFSDNRRLEMWEKGNQVDREFVARFVRLGLPVMGFGDYNRVNYKVMGTGIATRKIHYIGVTDSVDYLWFINGRDWKWKFEGRIVTRLNSDHDALTARVRLVLR